MNRATPPTAVDVAIVNWNTSRAALAAAEAYLASEGVEPRVTIVDNGSEASERRLLEEERPDGVELRLNGENVGFGAAANEGLRGGGGELVVASNADVLPEPGALAALAAAIRERPQAGMAGPVFDGEAAGYHADLPSGATMLARILVGSFRQGGAPTPAPGEIVEVGQPSGACFAVGRGLWEQVGGFDERFFLWYEDVDLALRLRESGHRNLLVGSARARHAGAGSFVQVDRRRQQAIRLDSVERYIRKHHPRLARTLAPPLLAVSRRLRAGGASGGSRRREAR